MKSNLYTLYLSSLLSTLLLFSNSTQCQQVNLQFDNKPYIEGEFLVQLMVAGYPPVFDLVGEYGAYYGILDNPSHEIKIAWFLLACKFRDVCDKAESIKQYCAYMMPECIEADNLYDVYRRQAVDPAIYAAAEAIAAVGAFGCA